MAFVRILLIIVLGAFLFMLVFGGRGNNTSVPPQPAAVTHARLEAFSEVGALALSSESGKLVPWLVYIDGSKLVTKALVVPDEPEALVRAYAGTQVAVSGVPEEEHVVVGDLSVAEAPNERIKTVITDLENPVSAFGITLVPRSIGRIGGTLFVETESVRDGTVEFVTFELGSIVRIGGAKVVLTYVGDGVLYFAFALAPAS